MLHPRNVPVAAVALAFMGQAASGQWYQYSNGHSYRLTPVIGTWAEAEAYAALGDCHLVTINDEDENTWLTETFPLSEPGHPNYWRGLYQDTDDPAYSKPDAGWKWINGEPVDYTHWHSAEPSGGNGVVSENHATLHLGDEAGEGRCNDDRSVELRHRRL